MNLSPKTILYINVALLFYFSYRFFSKLFIGFKTNDFDFFRLGLTGLALAYVIFQVIKYSKIINNSDVK